MKRFLKNLFIFCPIRLDVFIKVLHVFQETVCLRKYPTFLNYFPKNIFTQELHSIPLIFKKYEVPEEVKLLYFPYSLLIKSSLPMRFKAWMMARLSSSLYQKKNMR